MGLPGITIEHERNATTSRFRQVDKGVENLYYLLLLSSDAYAGEADRWKRWSRMGFGLMVREAPRSARPEDRVLLDTDPSSARRVPISLRGGNAEVVDELLALVTAADRERHKLSHLDEAARTDAIIASEALQDGLVVRLDRALADASVDAYDTAEFHRILRDAILVLTEDNVAAVEALAGASS
jgi:hypothetical protein